MKELANKNSLKDLKNKALIFGLVAVMALFIGFRPIFLGTDTIQYVQYFDHIFEDVFDRPEFEPLFVFLVKSCNLLGFSSAVFLSIISFLSFLFLFILAKKNNRFLEFPLTHSNFFIVLVTCLLWSPFFMAIQINVLRQGLSIFLVFLFYFCLLNRRKYEGFFLDFCMILLIAMAAIGFHRSAILYLLCAPLVFFSYAAVFSLVCCLSFAYILNLIRPLIRMVASLFHINLDLVLTYGMNQGYRTGTRLDFLLFTLACGWILFLAQKFFLTKENAKNFLQLLKIYWILIIPFLLMGFAGYSDRYLVSPWVFLSILGANFLILYGHKHRFFMPGFYYCFLLFSLLFCIVLQLKSALVLG